MRTAYRSGHYDGGIAVVRRVLPTTFGRIVQGLKYCLAGEELALLGLIKGTNILFSPTYQPRQNYAGIGCPTADEKARLPSNKSRERSGFSLHPTFLHTETKQTSPWPPSAAKS